MMEDMAVGSLVERLNEEASARNAKVKISFDPTRETIVTDSAARLVREFAINYAHRREEAYAGRPEEYASFRMVRYPGCKKARPDSDFGYTLGQSATPGLCDLHIFAETPPAKALMIESTWRLVEIEGYSIRRVDMVIKRPDGRSVALEFYPGQSDLDYEAAPQIASALGLKPRGSEVAEAPGPDEVDRLIAAATDRAGNTKYAWLDELALRDPAFAQSHSPSDFAAVEIGKRAEALTRRFELKASQADIAGYLKFIGDVLARLPQEDWVRYRGRLAAAMLRSRREDVEAQKKLILRMADMGGDVGPVLAHATSEGFVHNEIAIATCRAGEPVAPYMAKRLMAAWKVSNSPQLIGFNEGSRWRRDRGWRGELRRELRREEWDRCTENGKKYGPPANIAFSICWAIPDSSPEASPTYLALRRLGHGTEADAIMRHQYSKHWKKTYAAIGPASPAKVCGESKEI